MNSWKMNMGSQEWREDCAKWRGKLLIGNYAHWCQDWDGLPVDETTPEFTCCHCFESSVEIETLKDSLRNAGPCNSGATPSEEKE